jgi:hypothetical protein
LRGTPRWTLCAPVPVPPLLAEKAPAAHTTNPSEAFCGVETWILPPPHSHKADSATKALQHNAIRRDQPQLCAGNALLLARSDESALRDSLPGERAYAIRKCFETETRYSRRPLMPRLIRPELNSLPLVARLHPADPPLEPQGGRLHNLLRIARMNRIVQISYKAFENP